VIRIHRPATVPAILTRAAARAAAMHRAYLADRGAYRRGDQSFEFEKHYADPSVKAALRTAQHDKCAFCESKVSHVAFGDVEHFRPKAGFRQRRAGPLKRPGYYWLAYAWENLIFACEVCNRREKQSWFPVERGSVRARSPRHAIVRERPRFVDPASEPPEAHLTFREHCAIPVNGSKRGKITLRGLGLNRPALRARREDHLHWVRQIYELIVEPPHTPGKAVAADWLRRAARPEEEYSAMVRAYLQGKGFPLEGG
jgi:uncharacterized protein (TIGR02646 family)